MSGVHPVDVVGIGENSVDYVYRIAAYPHPDRPTAKQRILGRRVSFGGQVATTLATCAAFGLRTRYVGVFGSDAAAAGLRHALEDRGVDTSGAVVRDAPGRYAVILVADEGGERVVLWDRDPRLVLHPADVDVAMLRAARLLHVDAVHAAAARHAARAARDLGIPVTSDIDTIDDASDALLDAVSAPILAEHALAALTGAGDPERALRALRRRHSGLLCVTLGARGAMLLDGDRLHHHGGYAIEAVDTTGAGDVFRGAFIYALLRGEPPARMLRLANAAAALSCTQEGAIAAVPPAAAVESLAASEA